MIYFFIPAFIGLCIVLQGGINEKASSKIGLSTIVLVNMIITLILSVVYYFFSDREKIQTVIQNFHWAYLIPGICGFLIVLGAPLAIAKIGALKTFLIIVVAQTLFSMIWDITMLNQPVTSMKMIAVLISLTGVTLLSLN